MLMDLQAIEENDICMKHRPTEVSVEGAKLAVESFKIVCQNVKAGLMPITEHGLANVTKDLKKAAYHAKKCVKQSTNLGDKVILEKTMALPSLEKALTDNGCALFYQRLVMSGYRDMRGLTILAPVDDAFLGEGMEGFDEECFGVHIIDGPYQIGDMLNLNSGYTQPRSESNRHTIRTRMDLGGKFTFWLTGDSVPRRLVSAIKPDVPVVGGTVLHIVDKILHPSDAI